MFPIILYNFYLSYAINLININTSSRSLAFYVKYTTKIYPFIKFFKKINFIATYQIIKKNNSFYFKISPFYYKNINFVKNFKLISTPTSFYHVSLTALNFLRLRSGRSIYLISTSRGIFTHHEAINKKLSGYIVGFFFN